MGPGLWHNLRTVWVAPALVLVAVGCAGAADTPATQRPDVDKFPAGSRPRAVAADIDEAVEDFLDSSYSGAFDNLRAVLVTVDGQRIIEDYFNSSADVTSNVHSVTKSVMSTLVGIALDEGHLTSLDQTLGELLPSHAAAMTPHTAAITLRQVLTMTAGLVEDDTPGGSDYFATTDDWVATILAEGFVDPPGGDFRYANAGSHLLSAIVAEATGRSVLGYAREKLFTPLGIDAEPAAEPLAREENLPAYNEAAFAWPVDPQGYHLGFGYLKMTARDMSAVGQLFLDDGRWHGAQVVSAQWVEESTQPHVDADGTDHYGYQWWVTEADGHPAFAAAGSGGQLIEVVPDLGLVVVVSSVDAVGSATSATYMDLVSHVIAPALAGE